MINKITEKISANWIFFITVLLIYIFLAFFNITVLGNALDYFYKLILQILPVLGVVFLSIFLFDLFISHKLIIKYLGNNSGIKGYIIAILTGILSSGPIYMWYPLLTDLKKEGMDNSLITVFLYNRAVKIPLIPIMVTYFGSKLVIVLTIYMIIFSVINGIILDKIVKE